MGAFQMHFIAISINHRTADVALREQVTFRDDALRIAHEDLYETKSILENVILSTCNRTEVYAVVDQIHTGRYYIQRFLARAFGFEVASNIFKSFIRFKQIRNTRFTFLWRVMRL